MAWSSGCVRSECQRVHSVDSAHFPRACLLPDPKTKFLEVVFCVTPITWRRWDRQACDVVLRAAEGVLTIRPLIQRELSCRRRRLRVSLTTILAKREWSSGGLVARTGRGVSRCRLSDWRLGRVGGELREW
jgi:hypothetical protein